MKETDTKSQFDKSVLGKQETFSRLIQAGLVEFPATGGNHDHDHDRDDDDLEDDDDDSILLLSIFSIILVFLIITITTSFSFTFPPPLLLSVQGIVQCAFCHKEILLIFKDKYF